MNNHDLLRVFFFQMLQALSNIIGEKALFGQRVLYFTPSSTGTDAFTDIYLDYPELISSGLYKNRTHFSISVSGLLSNAARKLKLKFLIKPRLYGKWKVKLFLIWQ